ncbi:MAG TPA: ATP synthase F1 subunit delta [Bacteroidia bacterium]|nr:ATP synthase F1 subunit delta [Bacteroidia bacterium]
MAAADRYAKSLMDLALESNQLDVVRKDLKQVLSLCTGNRDFQMFLSSPLIKTDHKIRILNTLLGDKLDKLSMAFLRLITSKNRENQLEKILNSFEEQYKTHKNILTAQVTSAMGLDQKTRDKVLELVKSQLKAEIELVEKVDKDLIGGFVLRVGDKQIDRSVASDLSTLRKTLTNKALN